MKLKIEWFVILILIGIIILTNINYNRQYKRLENNYKNIVNSMSELKKVNEELWQKTQTDLNDLKGMKKELSDFGKKMIKDKDLKGLFTAIADIKEQIQGQGVVNKEGKVSFKGKKNGFFYEGWTLYPSGAYNLKLSLNLRLEGYAKEISKGVYNTYIKTDNPNVKISDFNFKIIPKQESFWGRFKLSIGLLYNNELGAGIGVMESYNKFKLVQGKYIKGYMIGGYYDIF